MVASAKRKIKRIKGEMGVGKHRGTVTVLSPVTHTDVQGGEKKEQEEDR